MVREGVLSHGSQVSCSLCWGDSWVGDFFTCWYSVGWILVGKACLTSESSMFILFLPAPLVIILGILYGVLKSLKHISKTLPQIGMHPPLFLSCGCCILSKDLTLALGLHSKNLIISNEAQWLQTFAAVRWRIWMILDAENASWFLYLLLCTKAAQFLPCLTGQQPWHQA